MSRFISEKDALPIIPEEVVGGIFDGVAEESAVLRHFDRLPDMSTKRSKMAILDGLLDADFTSQTVTDDLVYGEDEDGTYSASETIPGLKKTADAKWASKWITAEPIAIVLPIGEDTLEDAGYNIWQELQPRIVEAFGKRIDEAIIWGKGRPATWESGIVPTAINRGNVVASGTGADYAVDISNLMGVIEAQGFDPTGFIADVGAKAKLRNVRASGGYPLFGQGDMKTPDSLYGSPLSYVKNASFNKTIADLIVGDMKQAKYAIRKDLTFKLFTEGVITDDYGEVVANLMQNDMVALRVVMRLGWALPNPVHQLNPERKGYPFAVMTK